MPAVHRMGDVCTGHGCFPPRPNVQGAGTVFVNGIPAHRQSDMWAPHVCATSVHASVMAGGSSTVFAEKLSIARIGDPVACGSFAMTGSGNVFAGG